MVNARQHQRAAGCGVRVPSASVLFPAQGSCVVWTGGRETRKEPMDFGNRGRGGSKVDVESLERENDRGIDALQERVALLKQATHNIRSEADSHHSILDRMGDGMYSVGGMMSSINDKFKTVMNGKSSLSMGLGVVGCVGILLFLWYFTRGA